MKILKLNISHKGKSLSFKGNVEVPLKMVVLMGKRRVVGVAELGDKHVEVTKSISPFFPVTYDVNSVAKELLTKLGLTPDEINQVMSRVEVEEF